MIEGHTLAKKGQGGLALGTAIAASFLGNWVGILLLIAFIPVILALALQFRSWEMFSAGHVGHRICGTMSSGELPLKGWISGWIGLVVAFVGPGFDSRGSAVHLRQLDTGDGISYVPVLIGLFGLTEILRGAAPEKPLRYSHRCGAREFRPCGHSLNTAERPSFRTARHSDRGDSRCRCQCRLFLAYDVGKRRAKPEEQAKGAREAMKRSSCAEVANNANVGALCSRHLPSAFQVTHRRCHPCRFGTEKRGRGACHSDRAPRADLLHLLCADHRKFFLCTEWPIALVKPSVKLFSLPRGLLMPLIIPLCVLGAFAVNLNYFDVYVMLGSGLIGYLLHRFGFPLAPLVLAVILGPLADENLRRALLVLKTNRSGSFYRGPSGQSYSGCVFHLLRRDFQTKEGKLGAISKIHLTPDGTVFKPIKSAYNNK